MAATNYLPNYLPNYLLTYLHPYEGGWWPQLTTYLTTYLLTCTHMREGGGRGPLCAEVGDAWQINDMGAACSDGVLAAGGVTAGGVIDLEDVDHAS